MSSVRTIAGRRLIVGMSFRTVSGIERIGRARLRNAANALKVFFSGMEAEASPAFVSGFVNSSTPSGARTDVTIVSMTGGAGPFTYAWEAVDATGWTISHPTGSSTWFEATPDVFETLSGTFRCEVTDSAGAIVFSNTVEAQVTNLGGGIGVPL